MKDSKKTSTKKLRTSNKKIGEGSVGGREQNNIKEIMTEKNLPRQRVQEQAVNCVSMAEWEGKTRAENLYHCIQNLGPR